MKPKRKIVELGNSLAVTIPSDLCRMLNLSKGDTVEFEFTYGGRGLVLTKARPGETPHLEEVGADEPENAEDSG